MVKAVHDELVRILGGTALRVTYAPRPPTVVLLAGLQGAGKTTNAAKLARWFKQQGRNPLLVAADLQRPAAVEQLRVLGRQVGVPVFSEDSGPVMVAKKGLAEAVRVGRDVLIVDTAGRLHIDMEMMDQVREISETVQPHYTFLVIDAMTGQDAVTTAEAFHKTLQLDGVILTKVDGDARGGAALSVKEVVGKPIAFASTGEKLEDFELFHPDRMAGRILGMGDVLTLIDRAETAIKQRRRRKGRGPDGRGPFHARGLPGAAAGGQENGPAFGLDRDAPDGPQRSPQHGAGRRDAEAGGGDNPLHDPGRAGRPVADQRLPPDAYRRRLGDDGAGRQRPSRPVQAGPGVHAHGPRPGRDVAPERRQEGGGQAQEAPLTPCGRPAWALRRSHRA